MEISADSLFSSHNFSIKGLAVFSVFVSKFVRMGKHQGIVATVWRNNAKIEFVCTFKERNSENTIV